MLDRGLLGLPYEPEQYAADGLGFIDTVGVGVSQVVAVESQWTPAGDPEAVMDRAFADLQYVTALSHGVRGPELGAIVTAADPRHPDFGTELDRQLAHSDKVRGVRVKWARHPDPDIADWFDEPDFVATTPFLRGFEAIAERNLVFVSAAYSHQLGQLDMLARRFPDTPIVIDHLGLPVGVFGPVGSRTGMTAAARADILSLWRERMAMIATRPNVLVKVSGLGLPMLGYGFESAGNIGTREVLADMIGPLVLHVVDRFGPDRVIFGSNSPIDRPNAPVAMTTGALLDVLGGRGDYVLRQLFSGNSERVFKLGHSGKTIT